jgi:hypothetical protein
LARQHHARPAGQRMLKSYIDEFPITGLTSNPIIFDHAMKNSTSYDASISEKLRNHKSRGAGSRHCHRCGGGEGNSVSPRLLGYRHACWSGRRSSSELNRNTGTGENNVLDCKKANARKRFTGRGTN